MNDHEKTKGQLLEELAGLRQRVAALDAAEQLRQESEERYRKLTESTTDMIYILNRSGDVLYANRSAATGICHDATSLVGKRQDELFSPEKVQRHVASIDSVFQTGEVYDADGMYRFGSEEIWLNTRLMPLRNERGEVTAVMGVSRNITDRKRAEAALKQAHEELERRVEERTAELVKAKRDWERTFDSVPDLIAVLDRSSRIVRANRAMAERLGTKPEQCIGLACYEAVHGLSEPPEFCPHALTLADGKGHAAEIHEDRLGGDFLVTTTPIFDDNNQLIGSVHVARDITERKQAEEALRQSHDELRAICDGMVDGLLIADVETKRLVRANASICRMLGYSQDEMLSMSVTDIHPAETLPADLETFQAEAEGRIHLKADSALLRKDGGMLYADILSHTLIYGGRPCVVGFFRDTTERRRAEEALAESEAKYRHLVETTDTGYLILDEEGKVVDANDEYVRLTGRHSPAEIIGRSVVEWTAPYDAQRNAEEVAKCLREGVVRHLELDYVGPDGEVIPIEISASVVAGKQGKRIISLCRDITERKQAREALRQSEEKYRGLVDICPDSILVSDLTGRTQFVSKQTWKSLDLPEKEELVGKSTLDYVIEADRPRLAANLAELLRVGRRPGCTEYSVLRPDGTTVPIELSSAVIRDAQGQPTAMMAIIRNISERKRAQEAVRQSEEKYRELIEICPDAVVVTDLTGKATFVSRQAWRLMAISEQVELVGRSAFDFVIEPDRPRMVEGILELLSTGKHKHSEYTGLRPDGATIPTEISTAVIRDAQGQPIAMMAMIRDISDRKQAEETLRQHYEELRAIYDGMADGLVILDIETAERIRVNHSLCKMLGYSEEELKALPPDKLHPPEHLPKQREQYRDIVEGRASHTEDVPFVRKDGSIAYVDITSDRITYNGRPCLIHLLRDTTERRQAQEALKKEHRTLKHLLQSSDHERQLIAYEIHDGLAQQLAGAIMQLDTYSYQKDNRPKEAAKAYEAAITMLRQAHFETRRLISGVRPPILDESGIVAAVAHLVNEHRLQNGPKIEFRGDVSFDRLVPIMENAIYRIVQEGLANACKHSKSPKVRVEMAQRDGVLQIKVTDWGIGFDPNNVKDDRFGLEGIRERARLLGGVTTLQTAPGQGTCITVELPLALREK